MTLKLFPTGYMLLMKQGLVTLIGETKQHLKQNELDSLRGGWQ